MVGRRHSQSNAEVARGALLAHREPIFALAWRLLRQDATFRGLIEFALIALVVLAFLHRPAIHALIPSLGGVFSQSASRSASQPRESAAEPSTRPIAAAIANDKVSLRDLILDTKNFLFPRSPGANTVKIDATQFVTSRPEIQARLTRALEFLEFMHRPDEALSQLDNADKDDPNVMLLRGLAMATQPGSSNRLAGIELLRTAGAHGQHQAPGVLGVLLASENSNTSDVGRGLTLLEQAAAAGDANSASILSIAFYTGAFGTVDPARAAQYARLASDHGDADSTLRLAYFAYQGVATARDDAEAERLVVAAAEAGSLTAQIELGTFYKTEFFKGWITDGDLVVHWLEIAAKSGAPEPIAILADFYRRSDLPAWHDELKAAQLYRSCVMLRFDPCLNIYGMLLEKGLGVKRDVVKAYAMYALIRGPAAGAAREHMTELEKTMSASEREAADRLIDAAKTGKLLWILEIGEPDKDKQGCITAPTVTVCAEPGGTYSLRPAKHVTLQITKSPP